MGNKPSKEISRRDAIKILAAVAGATALVNLPDKWTKPGMEVGVLPAHAQTSLHTLAAGASLDTGLCNGPLSSTVTITPPTPGILMRYVIALTGGVTLSVPATSTGTVPTDAGGVATLPLDGLSYDTGTITVTWSFENASDGTGSDSQVFTSTAIC